MVLILQTKSTNWQMLVNCHGKVFLSQQIPLLIFQLCVLGGRDWALKMVSPLYQQTWFHMLGCMLRLPTFHHFHMRLKFGATFGLRVDSVTPSAPIFTPACAYLFLCRLANHNSYQTWSNAYMYIFFLKWWPFTAEERDYKGGVTTVKLLRPATEVAQGLLSLSPPFPLLPPP